MIPEIEVTIDQLIEALDKMFPDQRGHKVYDIVWDNRCSFGVRQLEEKSEAVEISLHITTLKH